MILKVADFLDVSKETLSDQGDDAEFEDCELDEGEDDEEENVIDLDQFKEQCIEAVFGWLE